MLIFGNSRRLCGILKKYTDVYYNQYRSKYIVLLPEVDVEIADKLLTMNEELPLFSKLTTEKLGTLMGKQIVDFECTVCNCNRKLEETPELFPYLFEDVFDQMEKVSSTFDTVWGITKTLFLTEKKLMPGRTYFSLGNRVISARGVKFTQDSIYLACKKYNKSKLTEEQARIVERQLVEGRLHGFEKNPSIRAAVDFQHLQLAKKQNEFRIRVEAARSQFFLTIDDPVIMGEFPLHVLRMMSNAEDGSADGPWTVKLHHGINEKFLEYCPDRNFRFMVWHGEDKAASLTEEKRELANSLCLEEIRHGRYNYAKLTGHKHYFEATLPLKMVGSLEFVQSVLSSYLEIVKPAQFDEVVQLQEFADNRGFKHPIQLWDVPYWSRKQKISLFRLAGFPVEKRGIKLLHSIDLRHGRVRPSNNFDDEKMRPFLSLERVLNSIFELCSRLFGIRFEELKQFDSWHPDVKFYYVFEPDSDKPTAGFYLDPYQRDSKIRTADDVVVVSPIRNFSRIPRPVMPLTALIMNLVRPQEKRPCCLSFSETRELFAKFGHNLQYLLNKSTYTDTAGFNGVEYEAIEISSKFLMNWLYDTEIFENMNCHYETGEKLTNINLDGVKKHMAALKLCSQLYKAQLDLRMHTEKHKFWCDMTIEMWDDYFIFPKSSYHSDPCRYVDLFYEQWGAAYYSHIWSDMLVADILKAFKEEEDEASVGARFRDTFLTFGGSCHASEIFRRFRGRDPIPIELINYYGYGDRVITEKNEKLQSENSDMVISC